MIGRKKERNNLELAERSSKSEFVAVYGRRRIGKTYLVRETFKGRMTFCHTGIENGGLAEQLRVFKSSLYESGLMEQPKISSWFDAFDALKLVVKKSTATKKILFLDELPWMDTPKSHFLQALEFFWNSWASAREDIVLVICGSATSWIINKVIKSRGGLHNRVTEQIWLRPFTLAECKSYAEELEIRLSSVELAEAYMAFGGVPYYWSYLKPEWSLAQAMAQLFFSNDAKLRLEFHQLYASLFKHPEPYIEIVMALAEKKCGLTREELVTKCRNTDTGQLSQYLEELEQCGFIRRYQPFGAKKKGYICQLIDNYTLFYLQFVSSNLKHDNRFWTSQYGTPFHRVWAGLAFERLCLTHVDELRKALGISGVVSGVCSWRSTADSSEGAQIDLLLDRDDRVINICEMKFSENEFEVDSEYEAKLRKKRDIFIRETGTKKAVHLTLVTTFGLANNSHSGVFQSVVTLRQLMSDD